MNIKQEAILYFSKQFNLYLKFIDYSYKDLHHGLASAEIYSFESSDGDKYEIHVQEGNIIRIFALKEGVDTLFAEYDRKESEWIKLTKSNKESKNSEKKFSFCATIHKIV